MGGQLLLLLVLFWLPAAFVPEGVPFQNTISTLLKENCLLMIAPLAFGLALLFRMSRPGDGLKSAIPRLRFLLPLLLLAVWIGIRLVTIQYHEAAFRDAHRWWCLLALAPAAGWLGGEQRFRQRACNLILVVSGLISVYALLQFYDYDFFDWGIFPWALPLRRVCASLGNPNFLGGYLVLTLPFTLAALLSGRGLGKGKARMACLMIQILVVALCIMHGGSRYVERLVMKMGWDITTLVRLGLTTAQVAGLLLPIVILLVLQRKKLENHYPVVLILFVQLIALGLTFSQGSLTAAMSGILFIVILAVVIRVKRRGWERRTKVAVACFVLLAVLGVFLLKPAGQLIMKYRERTVLERVEMYRGTVQMIKDRPLGGFGPGMFSVYFPEYRPQQLAVYLTPSENFIDHAHNEYLEMTSEFGLIGLCLFLWLLLSVLLPALKDVWRGRLGKQREWLMLALVAAILGTLLQNVVSVNLRQVSTAGLFWLMLGWLGGLRQESPVVQPEVAPSSRRWWLTGLLGVVVFVTSIINVGYVSKRYMGDLFLARSMGAHHLGRMREALYDARIAVQLSPSRARAFYFLGSLQYELEDYEAALKTYDRVYELEREFVDVLFNKATIHAKMGEYEKAIELYAPMLERDPRNPRLYDYYARMLVLAGQPERAVEYRRKAIELYQDKKPFFPNDARLYYDIGKNYMFDGQWHAAEQHLVESIGIGSLQSHVP